jgi:2-(1,2-epoxy-1,2-dihydrophenyl)acetyl-CoA isomerase
VKRLDASSTPFDGGNPATTPVPAPPGGTGRSTSPIDPTSAGEWIIVEHEDGVARVWLNRPHRLNAIPPDMWTPLAEVFTRLATDEAVRVVVLSGIGDSFCSGHDIGSREQPAEGQRPRPTILLARAMVDALVALRRIPQPTIARVLGHAVGGGAGLALACDLVVAGESAQFSFAFTQRGLVPDCAVTWVLPRLVGQRRATELLLLAETVTGNEAKELGLVNQTVPDTEVDDVVRELTNRLAAGPPIALALTKALLGRSFSNTLEETLEAEASSQGAVWATADRREAFAAFMQRRPPGFTGR